MAVFLPVVHLLGLSIYLCIRSLPLLIPKLDPVDPGYVSDEHESDDPTSTTTMKKKNAFGVSLFNFNMQIRFFVHLFCQKRFYNREIIKGMRISPLAESPFTLS